MLLVLSRLFFFRVQKELRADLAPLLREWPFSSVLAAVALGRVVGLVADGLEKKAIPPILVEFVMVGILVNAHLSGMGA